MMAPAQTAISVCRVFECCMFCAACFVCRMFVFRMLSAACLCYRYYMCKKSPLWCAHWTVYLRLRLMLPQKIVMPLKLLKFLSLHNKIGQKYPRRQIGLCLLSWYSILYSVQLAVTPYYPFYFTVWPRGSRIYIFAELQICLFCTTRGTDPYPQQ